MERRLLPIKLDSYQPLREVVCETLRNAIIQGVLKAETYFAFANTEKGQMLKQHFDLVHKRLIDSGEQDRLYLETLEKRRVDGD